MKAQTVKKSDTDRRLQILKSATLRPQRSGKAPYLKFLQGGTLTRDQAIRAKCWECNGDGEYCAVIGCPLLPFCQFNQTPVSDVL